MNLLIFDRERERERFIVNDIYIMTFDRANERYIDILYIC